MTENKRVLLVRPAPVIDQFGDESFMPLGIAYIAAVLEREGYEVRVRDHIIEPQPEAVFLRETQEFNPIVVGFTAVTPVVNSAYRLSAKLKEIIPGLVTIIGGPHATAMPDEGLLKGLDYVVRGEGEFTMLELMKNLTNPEGIRGLSYMKNGQPVHNPDREFMSGEEMDKLPFPARHLFPDIHRYKGQEALGSKVPCASIMTSRGCPFGCKFCYKAVFGKKFRARTPENIVAEIIYLKETYGVKEVAIVDDTFTSDVKRVIKFCDLLIEKKVNMRWSCPNGIRVDIGDLEMFKKMKKAGCYRTALGIESGSQRILDDIGKRISLKEIEDTVSMLKKAHIKTMGFFMLGNLGENKETMQETIDFAIRIKTDYAQFLLAIPYPGTALYEIVKREGKFFIENWDEYGQYEGTASFSHKEVTPELMKEMGHKASRQYYLNPGYLFRQFINPETYAFLPRRLKVAARIIMGKRAPIGAVNLLPTLAK